MAVTQIGTLVQFTTGNNAVADLNNNLSLITTQFNNLVTGSNALISGLTIPSANLTGTVAGTPTWGSNQAITLSTAAQPNVTSLGTLTTLSILAGGSASGAKPALLLYQASGLSTTNNSDTSLASYPLPAGTLVTNGQAVRITIAAHVLRSAGTPTFNIKFGATQVYGASSASLSDGLMVIHITRTGATSQLALGWMSFDGTTRSVTTRTTPAETLSGAITIDFRGSAGSGGGDTTYYDYIMVEFLES